MKFTKSVSASEVKRNWLVVDAKGKVFGRLITEIATKLRGKHKPCFTPNTDCGDFVVVINAKDVIINGQSKTDAKTYHRHTGYLGNVKSEKFVELLKKNPAKVYNLAVRGMLPKTKLGKAMIKKLKVYANTNHPHTAQTGRYN